MNILIRYREILVSDEFNCIVYVGGMDTGRLQVPRMRWFEFRIAVERLGIALEEA